METKCNLCYISIWHFDFEVGDSQEKAEKSNNDRHYDDNCNLILIMIWTTNQMKRILL